MDARERARVFCHQFGLRCPIVQAPMAGACPPELAIAVAQAGGMGASGVLLDAPAPSWSGCRCFGPVPPGRCS